MTRRRTSVEPLFQYGVDLTSRTIFFDEGGDNWTYAGSVRGIWLLSRTEEPFTVIMNHPGGNVVDGLAIYDLISSLPNHVTIKVLGEASSMGAIVLQSADHRIAYPNTEIMLHDGQVGFEGHARDFERCGKESARNRERMYAILAKRTGQSAAHFRRKLAHDWYLTPKEALKERLIDEIVVA